MNEKGCYFLYVLELENEALYAGITRDVASRFRKHQRGTGAAYTRSFAPVRIVGCWEVLGGRGPAMSVEAFFKNRSRSAKLRLLAEPQLLSREYAERAERSGTPGRPRIVPVKPLPTAPGPPP